MGNPFAGEVTLSLDGVQHVAKLTLGALAELEMALESGSLVDLISRFEAQHFSTRDVLALVVLLHAAVTLARATVKATSFERRILIWFLP